MTEDMMRKEMIMMKDMGVNFIRLGHYQQSRIILQLCDSLGIVVWEEIPWCRGGLGGDVYKDAGKKDAHQYDRTALQSSLRDHLGPGQ